MGKKKYDIPVPFLAFTFFYTVCIYILMLSFLYWREQKEDGGEV